MLEEVYENVLQLSPGAEFLLEECKRNDVKFMLVSGGFTFFTERLQRRLGLDFHFANVLEVENGKLTGRLKGRIIDARLRRICCANTVSVWVWLRGRWWRWAMVRMIFR